MGRTVKEADVRKTEIVDVAKELFITQGYDNTSVSQIINRIGIAKGTFYHHFSSKDSVLDHVIAEDIQQSLDEIQRIASNPSLDPIEKMREMIRVSMAPSQDSFRNFLHQPENVKMHQRSLVEAVKLLAPVIAAVVDEGIEAGCFRVQHSQGVVEFLLAGMNFLLDPSVFEWSELELLQRAMAVQEVAEKALSVEPGTLAVFSEMAGSQK